MAKALDWLREGAVDSLEDDDDGIKSLGISSFLSFGADGPEKRSWKLRSAGCYESKEGIDDADFDFDVFGLEGGLPQVSGEAHAQEMANALNWLRRSTSDRNDDESASKFSKLDALIPWNGRQSKESRAVEIENALSWLRSKDIDLVNDDMGIESFSRLGVAPIGCRSAEVKEEDLESISNWQRNPEATLLILVLFSRKSVRTFQQNMDE